MEPYKETSKYSLLRAVMGVWIRDIGSVLDIYRDCLHKSHITSTVAIFVFTGIAVRDQFGHNNFLVDVKDSSIYFVNSIGHERSIVYVRAG